MNKPNTPQTPKPSTASIENHTPPTAPVSRIKHFNPSRDLIGDKTLDAAKANTQKLFEVLSKGMRVNTLDCSKYGFASHTAIHSVVASLEASYGLPVDRKYIDGKIKEYWFSPRTLAALDDPEKLDQIRDQFRRHMERRRLDKGYSNMVNFLSWVANDPHKFERNPELPEMLSELSRYLTAVEAGAGQQSAGG